MQSRREFVRTVTLVAGATLLPARAVLARLAEGTLKVTKLRDGVWVITEGGGNSLLLATTEGPVLVDTKVSAVGQEMIAETSKTAGAAPNLVINTHHHADHTGGNYAFSRVAQIAAHKNLMPRLAATLDESIRPGLLRRAKELTGSGKMQAAYALEQKAKGLKVEDFAPDREVVDAHELTHGGVKIRLRHFGRAHTDNDLVVRLPDLNILHTGDLVFHRLHPFVDRDARATTRGWQKSLRAMREMCNESTVVVPGHGEITNAGGLMEQYDYFAETRKAVEEARKKGLSKDDVTDIEVEQFKGYGFDRMRSRTLGTIYDELEAGE